MKKLIILFPVFLILLKEIKAQIVNKPVGKISKIDKRFQQGGIFDGKTPQQEILEKRTEFTKKFDKGNGVVDVLFGGPFHYKDATGALQDIDLNIKTQPHPKFSYYNSENNFTSRFAQNVNDG